MIIIRGCGRGITRSRSLLHEIDAVYILQYTCDNYRTCMGLGPAGADTKRHKV
jgi:hypothetical protein